MISKHRNTVFIALLLASCCFAIGTTASVEQTPHAESRVGSGVPAPAIDRPEQARTADDADELPRPYQPPHVSDSFSVSLKSSTTES